ncbi:Uncharacterized protein ChrSV_0524 [Chromobacterium vaccinii]|nr:Uncharacterized protein ChrSW_0524 [Chromobacterium vaccinii]QND87983.1 Uncharacterized protein ChrSV_0524 [Chromobacterium vaccinii]
MRKHGGFIKITHNQLIFNKLIHIDFCRICLSPSKIGLSA